MGSETFLSLVKKLTEQHMPVGELIGAAEMLKASGEGAQVPQLYALWIKCNPTDPLLHVALFNYAVMQSDGGDLEGARASLERAIELNPDFAPAYINIGNVMERSGKAGDAITQWTALANRMPSVTGQAVNYKLTALKQIGRVLESHKFLPNAEKVLRQSLEIDPKQQDVLQHYVALRLAQCEWPVVQPWDQVDRKLQIKGTGPLSMAVYTDDPVLQLASGWNYCKNFITWPKQDYSAQHKKASERKGRRRIGYVSSDLRNHAVGFIMAEVFGLHDREKYEIFAYYCGVAGEDALKDRIKGTVDHWLDINSMSDDEVARRMIDDGIDILVDVNGYTKDARTKVFGLRPAPIIVNWLGFPGTMASPYHHYIVADNYIIPPEHEKYFSEKVVRLPCYQPNDRKRAVSPNTPTRADVGLPEHGFVFCSFNGVQKISRHTFDRWMEILKGVENSVLWLLDGGDGVNDRLRQHAKDRGVDPSRLVFADKKGNPDHLARYPLADLFLDTVPYGAHVTASDALWMGVPILTFSGRGFAARVCGSLVTAAGLPEMVCSGPEEFVIRAIELGKNKEEIRRLKKKLAENRDKCLLFDTPGLIKHLEKAYDAMWEDYRKDRLPRPNLTNIDVYLDAGCEHDHDAEEMLRKQDYEAWYKAQLAQLHRYHPLPEDGRLWTAADIKAASK